MKTKVCTKCKIEKSTDEFYKHCRHKDGFHTQCKKCDVERNKKRLENNPDTDKETIARWKKNNSERIRELERRWINNNPEKFKAKQKAAKLKSVRNAADSYLKDQIRKKYGVPIKMITRQMILIERISLLSRRLIAGRGENTKELLIQTVQQYKKERVIL